MSAILQRDRMIVGACLAALVVLAWSYLLHLAFTMHVSMAAMAGMAPAWTLREFALAFAMWSIMMVGMMTPSAAPVVLVYARVVRVAAVQGKPLAATGWFLAGYLLVWTVFALIAAAGQWALQRGLLLTPVLASSSAAFSGVVLVTAGLYQWTPLKHACLGHCQAPLGFIQRHGGFRGTVRSSLALGLRHGLHCAGCCWALMALLFVGGVMNLLWIALLAFFVLLEKNVPSLRWLPRTMGAVFAIAGTWLLMGSV